MERRRREVDRELERGVQAFEDEDQGDDDRERGPLGRLDTKPRGQRRREDRDAELDPEVGLRARDPPDAGEREAEGANEARHTGSVVVAGLSRILPDPSVARRVDREMFLLLGGTAALLMQVAHPLVAAGVEQHSDFRSDPLGRLRRTLDTTLAVVFGDERAARAAIDRMNRIHSAVRGTTATGDAYAATDPRLLLWVQTTLALTSLRVYEHVTGPLDPDEREAYWRETRPIATALGVPADRLPATIDDLERFEREMLASEVVPDATARGVGRDVLRPFRWIPDVAYWPNDALAAALLPPPLRAAFGLRYGTAERLFFRAVVVAVRRLRRLLPDALTVVPQARRYERASRTQS